MRKLASIAAIGTLGLALAACSSDDTDETPDTTGETTTEEETPEDDAATDEAPADETEDDGGESDGSGVDLNSVALTAEDFPEGWDVQQIPADAFEGTDELTAELAENVTVTPAECSALTEVTQPDFSEAAVSMATNMTTGESIVSMVVPESFNLDEYKSLVPNCGEMTSELADENMSVVSNITQQEIDAPSVSGANETFGLQQETQSTVGEMEMNSVSTIYYVLFDDVTIMIMGSDTETGVADLTAEILEVQVSKL